MTLNCLASVSCGSGTMTCVTVIEWHGRSITTSVIYIVTQTTMSKHPTSTDVTSSSLAHAWVTSVARSDRLRQKQTDRQTDRATWSGLYVLFGVRQYGDLYVRRKLWNLTTHDHINSQRSFIVNTTSNVSHVQYLTCSVYNPIRYLTHLYCTQLLVTYSLALALAITHLASVPTSR